MLGVLEGLTDKDGLYDSAPTSKTVAGLLGTNELKRKLVVGATDLVTG
jgi:hypothetical protein